LVKNKKSTYAMSRRLRTGITILGVLLAAFLVWFDQGTAGRKRQAQPKSQEQARSYDLEKYHAKTFTVVNVVDGDTIDIDAADGKYNHTRIRLWGIDTPETKNPQTGVMYFGPEAAEFTRKLAFGKPVTVYLDKTRTRDKYDRLLAYIKLPDGGFLNEVLLTEGFAYADTRFKHNFYNKYKQLEAGARGQKKGLWQGVTPEQWPEWRQNNSP
jgi:micrococcal nuclease